MFAIEKNVPLPERRKGRYPWHDMEIGDSFVVRDRTRGAISSVACYQGKRTGKTFRVTEEADCVRVWRVA